MMHVCNRCALWKLGHVVYRGYRAKRPYLPCVSMAGRALLAGYHGYVSIFVRLFQCLHVTNIIVRFKEHRTQWQLTPAICTRLVRTRVVHWVTWELYVPDRKHDKFCKSNICVCCRNCLMQHPLSKSPWNMHSSYSTALSLTFRHVVMYIRYNYLYTFISISKHPHYQWITIWVTPNWRTDPDESRVNHG